MTDSSFIDGPYLGFWLTARDLVAFAHEFRPDLRVGRAEVRPCGRCAAAIRWLSMKRHRHLREQIATFDNLAGAARDAMRGKRGRQGGAAFRTLAGKEQVPRPR